MNSVGEKRNKNIDLLKGVGIIFMVIGHLHFQSKYFVKLIYSFHMPLFFVIAGYLYTSRNDIWGYIKRKAIRLLIPYFSFSVLYLVLQFFIDKTHFSDKIISVLLYPTFDIPLESALWFLPAMFWCCVFYALMERRINNRVIFSLLIIIGTFVGCLWNSFSNIQIPFSIAPAISAFGFFHIGQLIKKNSHRIADVIKWYYVLAVSLVSCFLAIMNDSVSMMKGKWGGGIPAFLHSCDKHGDSIVIHNSTLTV